MMRLPVWLAAVSVVLAAGASQAQDVLRAPAPDWVRSLTSDSQASATDAAPIRILALDEQVRFDAEGVHTHIVRRIRIQTAQGLGMVSTVSAVWSPPSQRLEVHRVRILRGDQVIDVLESQAFQTLQREDNLESSMLDGRLTATLQPRDLRVGDVLETAFTIHDDGGVLAPHRELLKSVSSGLTIDHYRMRATWPATMEMQVKGPETWEGAAPRRQGDQWVFEVDRRAVLPPRMPDDLPTRYYLDKIFQFTDFTDWAAISKLMAPLYVRAETLEADSPLRAEIERIRASIRPIRRGRPPPCVWCRTRSAIWPCRWARAAMSRPRPMMSGAAVTATARARPSCCWPCCTVWASRPRRCWSAPG